MGTPIQENRHKGVRDWACVRLGMRETGHMPSLVEAVGSTCVRLEAEQNLVLNLGLKHTCISVLF